MFKFIVRFFVKALARVINRYSPPKKQSPNDEYRQTRQNYLNKRLHTQVNKIAPKKKLSQQDKTKIGQLQKEGANISSTSGSLENTPLHYAISQGNWQLVHFLLTLSPDLNKKNKAGATPLSLAVNLIINSSQRDQTGVNIAFFLLKAGASLAEVDKQGRELWHVFTGYNGYRMWLALNSLDRNKVIPPDGLKFLATETLMYLAEYYGSLCYDTKVVTRKKAVIYNSNYAYDEGSDEEVTTTFNPVKEKIIIHLLQIADSTRLTEALQKLFYTSNRDCWPDSISRLLEAFLNTKKIDLSATIYQQKTLLAWAIQKELWPYVERIIDFCQKAHVDLKEKQELFYSILSESVLKPSPKRDFVITNLIEMGARYDWVDPVTNNNLLHRAINEGKFHLLALLIRQGVSLVALNNDNLTPLQLATTKGMVAIQAIAKARAESHTPLSSEEIDVFIEMHQRCTVEEQRSLYEALGNLVEPLYATLLARRELTLGTIQAIAKARAKSCTPLSSEEIAAFIEMHQRCDIQERRSLYEALGTLVGSLNAALRGRREPSPNSGNRLFDKTDSKVSAIGPTAIDDSYGDRSINYQA